MYLLKNKQVVITGGGSKVGLELGLHFGKNGSKIILIDEDKEQLEKAYQILSSFDITIKCIQADTLDESKVVQVAKELEDTGKPVDILINAAGLTLFKKNDSNSLDWKKETEVILKGSRNAIKFFSPIMEKGLIINIIPFPEVSASTGANLYSSLKTGLNALTTIWARELGATGTRVNSIVPGYFEEFEVGTVQTLDNLKERIPVGRLGNVNDISAIIGFLASAQASYINGATIPLDGGYFS